MLRRLSCDLLSIGFCMSIAVGAVAAVCADRERPGSDAGKESPRGPD